MNELPKMEQVKELESHWEMACRNLDEALTAVEWGRKQIEKIQEGGKDSLGAEVLDVEMYRSAVRDSLEKLRAAYEDVFVAIEEGRK